MREPALTRTYKRYVLATLTLGYTLSISDQGLIGLLLEPIKQNLHLSDTQLGFLTGIAFALFYAALGLPIARWADRGDRTTIASIAIGLWGLTVMMCLFVTSFTQLVIARVAASVGAAGCMPATYSLVGDYFPAPSERIGAMTIYTLANPLSMLLSFILGGRLNELYGWRVAFVAIGMPALVIAALVKMTITEPRASSAHIRQRLPGTLDVLRTLWHQRSSRQLCFALIVLFTLGYGLAPWYAAFLMRSHRMGTTELGIWMGLVLGLGGVAGTMLGGYVADRWFAQDERGQMRLIAVSLASLVPCLAFFLLLSNKVHALIAFVPFTVLLNLFFGPTFAVMQRLVVDEMRATTVAVVMLLCNLIGMGVGPQVVGVLSDALVPLLGNDSLRYAMLIMSMMALWAAHHFWLVGRTIKEDLSTVERRIQPAVNEILELTMTASAP